MLLRKLFWTPALLVRKMLGLLGVGATHNMCSYLDILMFFPPLLFLELGNSCTQEYLDEMKLANLFLSPDPGYNSGAMSPDSSASGMIGVHGRVGIFSPQYSHSPRRGYLVHPSSTVLALLAARVHYRV